MRLSRSSEIHTASGIHVEIDDAAKVLTVKIGSDADDRILARCRQEASTLGYDLVIEGGQMLPEQRRDERRAG